MKVEIYNKVPVMRVLGFGTGKVIKTIRGSSRGLGLSTYHVTSFIIFLNIRTESRLPIMVFVRNEGTRKP